MININNYLSTSLIKGSRKNTKVSVSLPNLKPVSNVIYLNQWRRNDVQQTNTQVN